MMTAGKTKPGAIVRLIHQTATKTVEFRSFSSARLLISCEELGGLLVRSFGKVGLFLRGFAIGEAGGGGVCLPVCACDMPPLCLP